MTWFVAQIQYHIPYSASSGKPIDASVYGLAYVNAKTMVDAVEAIQSSPACTVRGFSLGKKTQVVIHTVEDLDESMEARDLTPKRRRTRNV